MKLKTFGGVFFCLLLVIVTVRLYSPSKTKKTENEHEKEPRGYTYRVTSNDVVVEGTQGGEVIVLPPSEETFVLDFHSRFNILKILVEAGTQKRYLYSSSGIAYDENFHKIECVDSLNLHSFRHQDNDVYEMTYRIRKMKIKVKANPSKHCRIIEMHNWVAPDFYPVLTIKQLGTDNKQK